MGKGPYYIGILLILLCSVSFVIYQYKKDSSSESAIAKNTSMNDSEDLTHQKDSNLLTNRDMDLIQLDGFEHENTSKIGQLREQFTISLHMAYIGIHSLSNQKSYRENSPENNEETYNRVIIELQNSKKTLNPNTAMFEKLQHLITKANESNVKNQKTLNYLYEEIHKIDALYNKSIKELNKADTKEIKKKNVPSDDWLESMINRLGSPNPYRYVTQDDFDYYTAKYIRDYLMNNTKQDAEMVIVKVEKTRNIAEQLMDASQEEKERLTNALKDALQQLK